jgi:hypothetical protein
MQKTRHGYTDSVDKSEWEERTWMSRYTTINFKERRYEGRELDSFGSKQRTTGRSCEHGN